LVFQVVSFQWTWPIQAPNIPCTKYHVHFPVLRLCQVIRPVPRLCVVIRNKYWVLWGRIVSPPPHPQTGGPPPVGCPRLLIQYIRSCPPYLEAVSIRTHAPCRIWDISNLYSKCLW
jgi:hypothetical protein